VCRMMREVEKIWKNGGSIFFPQYTKVTINLFLGTLSTSWLHIWISQVIYYPKSRSCLFHWSCIPLARNRIPHQEKLVLTYIFSGGTHSTEHRDE
jgi:hypothetical protein